MLHFQQELVEKLSDGVDLSVFGYEGVTGADLHDFARWSGQTPQAWARQHGCALRETFIARADGSMWSCPWTSQQIEAALLKRMGYGRVPEEEAI